MWCLSESQRNARKLLITESSNYVRRSTRRWFVTSRGARLTCFQSLENFRISKRNRETQDWVAVRIFHSQSPTKTSSMTPIEWNNSFAMTPQLDQAKMTMTLNIVNWARYSQCPRLQAILSRIFIPPWKRNLRQSKSFVSTSFHRSLSNVLL